MKKICVLIFAFCLLLCAACERKIEPNCTEGPAYLCYGKEKPEQEIIHILKIDGSYYYDTDVENTMGPRCGVMDGYIVSGSVPIFPYSLPANDNETNFGVVAEKYGYQLGHEQDTIEVLENGTWKVYKKVVADDINAYRYVYVLTSSFPDETNERSWLIFSNRLDLTFQDIQNQITGDFGRTEEFYYQSI